MKTKLPAPFDRFVWSGGIENTFIPQERPGLRALEEFELTQHYQQWRGDLDRATSLGISALRWGPPWYRVEAARGKFDWGFADEVLDHLINKLKITPILDLMHYGTPLWLEDSFANPGYPELVSEYAAAFAERYRHLVRFYTPLNEPIVNADFAGRRGEWPPYRHGDRGFVTVLLSIVRGIQRTVRAVRSQQADAQFVAVEAMRRIKPITAGVYGDARKNVVRAAHLHGLKDYLAYDLAVGRVTLEHPLYQWLIDNGAPPAVLDELSQNGIEYDVCGINFYPWSYAEVELEEPSGDVRVTDGRCGGFELVNVIRDAARHMGKPIMITETSAPGTIAERREWMDSTLRAVNRTRNEGVDVVGYTWFPLFTMIGWEYRASGLPIDEHLLHLGLWDCQFDDDRVLVRHETPLVNKYRRNVKRAR